MQQPNFDNRSNSHHGGAIAAPRLARRCRPHTFSELRSFHNANLLDSQKLSELIEIVEDCIAFVANHGDPLFKVLDITSNEPRWHDRKKIVMGGEVEVIHPATGSKVRLDSVVQALAEKRCNYSAEGYIPYFQPFTVSEVFNEYVPSKFLVMLHRGWDVPCDEPTLHGVMFLLHFIHAVIASGRQNVSMYLIYYLAHMIQKPDENPEVAIALLGHMGTGKGRFAELIRALVGASNFVDVANVQRVLGNFNSSLRGKVVCKVDEVEAHGLRRLMDRLKDAITNSRVMIHAKFRDPVETANSLRWILMSNHASALSLDPDDRRFLVLQVSTSRQRDGEYWKQFQHFLQDDATMFQFYHFLASRDLSSFDIRAYPRTEERQQCVAQAPCFRVHQFLADWCQNHPTEEVVKLRSQGLYEEYGRFTEQRRKLSTRQQGEVRKALFELGFKECHPRVVLEDGSSGRATVFQMSARELGDILRSRYGSFPQEFQ